MKKRILFSLLVALGASAINILHKKIGGLLAGGNYSTAHSWQEIWSMIPSFSIFFLVVFIASYFGLYYFYK